MQSPITLRDIGIILLLVAIEILTIFTAYKLILWSDSKPETAPVAIKATLAPEVKNTPLVSITPAAPVKVYAPQAKVRLHLPAAVISDDTQHVSTSTRIKSSDNPQTVTTVFNEKTGESTDYVTQEAMPWLAVDLHGEIGLAYGIKNGGQAMRLSARQNLIDIKSIRIGITATADQPVNGPVGAEYFIGAGAWYRW